jgi:uncharacterized 2Fe-2S/4Fe-4S cluster protein (DUF4445 family)
MSKITYVMDHPADGLGKLQNAIIDGLNSLIKTVTAACGLTSIDILEITLVGNTAMHHIFLGIDPRYLGASPYQGTPQTGVFQQPLKRTSPG